MYKNKGKGGRCNLCGEKVRRLRKGRGFSQRKLADELQLAGLDVDKNAIQRVESGQRFVTDIELKKFAAIFNVSVDDLLQG